MNKKVLGKIYVGDNENVIFTIEDGVSSIYLMNDECDYKLLLSDRTSDKKLNFNEHHQITGIYRLRRGCEKTIYFTDNYNPPRYLNISDINSFKEILQTSPLMVYGDVDVDKLLLQKVYDKIPHINAQISSNGQLLSGSYNFSVRYVDEDLNPTEWIYTTEPIMIWQDISTDFSKCRASTNDDVEYRKYGPTNKSIRVSCDNSMLDHSYMFIQFAMICANSGTGFVNETLYSPLIELNFNKDGTGNYINSELSFLFTGGSDVIEGNEEEILAVNEIFDKAKCLEQADNRLIMGNITDMDIDWCKLQKYASRINTDCIIVPKSICDYYQSDKNPEVLFNHGVGYQPGEIYSFGIVYVFENGVKSPVYHIPGRKKRADMSDPLVPFVSGYVPMSDIDNECMNTRYSDIAMSCEGFKYWGYDSQGNELSGEKVRHHRFPFNRKLDSDNETFETERRYIAHYNMIVGLMHGKNINLRFKNHFDTIYVKYNVNVYNQNTNDPNPDIRNIFGSVSDKQISSDTFDLHINYKEKGFWHAIYKNLDVTLSNNDFIVSRSVGFETTNLSPKINDLKALPFIDSDNSQESNYAINNGVYFNSSGYNSSDQWNNELGGHLKFASVNFLCSNPNPKYDDSQKIGKKGLLKNKKQHRYLDVFSLDITDGDYAMFECLQEYPQFRENAGGMLSRPIYLTTGCTISFYKYYSVINYTVNNDNKKEKGGETLQDWIDDEMEALPDNFFLNKVKVFWKADNTYKSNRRCKLIDRKSTGKGNIAAKIIAKNIENGLADYEEKDYPLIYKIHNKNYSHWIGTSIGFKIEPRIEITEQYKKDAVANIMGVHFSNIYVPDSKYLNGHKIIGYYIVQNERTEEDVTVLDSAILTPLFTENRIDDSRPRRMITSGKIFANDYFASEINNSSIDGEDIVKNADTVFNSYFHQKYFAYRDSYSKNITSDLVRKRIYDNGVGMIFPQFKFNKKEYYDFYFKLEGFYYLREGFTRYSTDFDETWIIQDVQPGTSYNKKLNKKSDEDSDGFDLHIFHQNHIVKYESCPDNYQYETMFVKEPDVHYMTPSSSIEKYFNTDKYNVYNASGDNTNCILFDLKYKVNGQYNHVDCAKLFTTSLRRKKIERLPYGYLIRKKQDYYSNFKDRPYYIVSDFSQFGSNTRIYSKKCFGGDCFISPMRYTNSIQYDIKLKKRDKKSTIANYILGSIGVVGGVVGGVFTGGAVGPQLIGPSISLIQNGMRVDIAYNNMKNFQKNDGKKSISDGWALQYIEKEQLDDEIQWMCESIDGLFFESRINMNWRVGTTVNDMVSYLDPINSCYSIDELKGYFMKKLTFADQNQGDGRMYRGFATAEIYDTNKDFERRNRQKIFYCIPITHRCCSECENKFSKRIVYSQKSFSEERVDNYKVFLPGNYKDIQGESGDITYISYNGQNAFMVFAEEGLFQLPAVNQQQQNKITHAISFIGTGDFFASEAQKVLKNDVNISFGTRHQNSFCNTPNGLFYYSDHDNCIYMYNGQNLPVDIVKSGGIGKWFERNGRLVVDEEFYKYYRNEFPFKDNPSSKIGTGYVLGWDNKYERLLITKKDNEVDFLNGECFYDSDQRTRLSVYNRANALILEGKKNVCYKWSKEYCCYIIDYDEVEINPIAIDFEQTEFQVQEYEYTDVVYLAPKCEYIRNNGSSVGVINAIIDKFITQLNPATTIIATTQDIYDIITSKDPDNPFGFYDIEANSMNRITDFILHDWPIDYSATYGLRYIVFTADKDDYNDYDTNKVLLRTNELSNLVSKFRLDVYPVIQEEFKIVDFSTFNDMLSYYGYNGTSYNNTYIDDSDLLCLLEAVDFSEIECPDYESNLDDYKEILSALADDIKEEIDVISGGRKYEDYKFESIANLLYLANTYNYWNQIKNSYDFNEHDEYTNGNKNLILFHGISDEFDKYAIGILGNEYCDADVTDYNNLATDLPNQNYKIAADIEGLEPGNVVAYCTKLFNDVYESYKLVKYNELKPSSGCLSKEIMESVDRLFSYNRYSLTQDLKKNINIENTNKLFGNHISANTTVHDGVIISNNPKKGGVSSDSNNGTEIIVPQESYVESVITRGTVIRNSTSSTIPFAMYIDRREYYLPEQPDTDNPEEYIEENINYLRDNSFTLSYKPGVGFVSFHSYLPNIYIYTPKNIYTWKLDENECYIYKHNVKGDYLDFYGMKYPFVLEIVDKNDKTIFGGEFTNSTSLLVDVSEFDDESNDFIDKRNVFFNYAYFYNSRQCTGFKEIYIKPDNDADYFNDYLDVNADKIAAEKREMYWHMNDIRDMVYDYTMPLHTETRDDRNMFMAANNMNGWIDKALNNVFDNNKPWNEIEPFKDNYICQRFFYDGPNIDESNSNVRFIVKLNTTNKTMSIDNTIE